MLVAEIGDAVQYAVRVRNLGGPTLPDVSVTDRLPLGFRYIAGSARLARRRRGAAAAGSGGGRRARPDVRDPGAGRKRRSDDHLPGAHRSRRPAR